jgi:hypothetical protein
MADSVQDGTRMNSLIHRAVRRDLDGFARALDSFPAGDRERATALAARFQWFDTLLTHHHEGEEGSSGRCCGPRRRAPRKSGS